MVAALYTLKVNSDGSQHTDYPDGDKGGAVPGLVAPDSLSLANWTQTSVDISWGYSSSGHTGFELQGWITDESTAWIPIAAGGGPTLRFFHAAGLPSGKHLGFRIRATDEV